MTSLASTAEVFERSVGSPFDPLENDQEAFDQFRSLYTEHANHFGETVARQIRGRPKIKWKGTPAALLYFIREQSRLEL